MTRAAVYACGLVGLVAAAILTILSITLPRWVLYHDSTPHGHDLSISLGLDKRCVIDGNQRRCSPFPGEDECHASERGFCTLWRSIGFLMNTAVLGELVLIVVFVVLLAGGRGKREKGWKLAAGLVMLVAAMQCTSMAVVAYLYNHNERFFVGWNLGPSWAMATASWAVQTVIAGVVVVTALLMAPEGDYELIRR